MNPEVASLLEELASDTNKASVTFFPMGLHTHLMSDGMGGWNLQVHTTQTFEGEGEQVISAEEHLLTEDLVMRMSMLAMVADVWIDEQVSQASVTDDEIAAFFANDGE